MRRQVKVTDLQLVECLENRMLLSAWAGTWKLQLQEVNAESGHATIAPINKSAMITDVSPGHYQLSVAGGVFTADLSGDDTVLSTYVHGADPKDGSWRDEYVHLQMIDPGVILVAVGTVGYDSSGQNSIQWINGVGGIATRTTIPVTQVPWAGTYTAHSMDVSADMNNSGSAESSADPDPTLDTINIVATGPSTFTAGSVSDSNPGTWTLSGNKLVQNRTLPNGETSDTDIGMVFQAPYGRLIHVGTYVEFNSSSTTFGSPGQIRAGYMDVTFTDPAVNIAPTLNSAASPFLAAIDEDATDNGGTLVSDILSTGGSTYIYDPNTGDQQGIAVVKLDTKNGRWQYLTDGNPWQDTGTVNASSALLLAPDAALRFVPKVNYSGTLSKAITFRAWDQSSGTNGGRASVNASAGMAPFSKALGTASLVVNAVNDAPVLSGNSTALTYTAGAKPVSVFAGMKLTDVDSKMITSAKVTLSNGYDPSVDVLTYRGPKTIHAEIDAAAGTVELSSATPLSLSAYQAAIKGIVFSTSSRHNATVTFDVVDEDAAKLMNQSTSVDRILQII